MGEWSRFRPTVLIPLALVALVSLLLLPRPGGAAPHGIGNDCYACHNIRSGQVWQGSYSIWKDKPIGMTTYNRAITCDVCHTNYGTSRFTALSASHHPVQVISGPSMATDNWTTTLILCKDCHNGDTETTLVPNLVPDLAPRTYTLGDARYPLDGYPNHDVASPDNLVNAGDPPHLLAMRLSAGQRTVAGSGTYTRLPSSNPSNDYGFCFSCHDGSNNTSRGATDNILDAYMKKGHYFKSAAPTGGAINDRIPCSDCHASHNSATNARLFEPDNNTWTPSATRPIGLTMAIEASPTPAETRAICMFCHEDYSPADTTTTAKRVRNVQPIRRKYGVTGHAGTDTQSCNQCHNTHNPPAGGDDCLNCHRTGGSVLAKHQMTDLEFPADGTPGEDNATLQVSGHKGVVYTTPYNTKALNECKKCHGTAHPTDAAKVQAADGTATWPTGFVYGLSWNGSAWSANAASFADTNANNIIDGNEFCLSCHDGVDALSPTDNANIRIGGVNPPVAWFPSAGQSTGHDRKSGSNYPVTGNAPAQQLCTSCHKYHTSDRPQLFPGNVGPFGAGNGYTYAMPTWAGIATNWQAPRPATAATPSSAGRMVIGTVNANALNFTDRSNPASGKGFGTTGAKPGTDGFCNACHRDAATVTAGTLNSAHTHEGDNTAFGSHNIFVKDCVECHNPHGGGPTPNIAMIRERLGRDNTTQNAVVFAALTGANSFDENDGATEANGDDVCATCHNNPPITHNYRTFAGAANHYQGANCVTCHPHGQTDNAAKFGFPQGSCTACHGNATNGTFWPDNTAAGAAYPNRTGAHVEHINAIYNVNSGTLAGATVTDKKNNTCDWCHPNPGGSNHDNNANADNTADVHRDPYNLATHFKTITGATNGSANDNYAPATHSCGMVDCHYRTATPTNGWVNPPVAMTCASCHPASQTSFDNTKLPNAHVTHASTANGKGYACAVCHPSGTYVTSHESGRVNLDFTNTLDPGASRTEVASGSDNNVKYGAAGSYATCSVFYCHGNFTPGGLSATPRWDNVASGDCGTCHMGNGTAGNLSVINTGNHTVHLDNGASAVGPRFGNANCQVCHTGWTLADNTHVSGTLTFRNDNVSVPWSVLGTLATVSATDNSSTDRCTGCHSTTNIAGVGIGTALAKTPANWDNSAYKLDCRTCHNAAYPSWDNVGKTGVRAPAKDTNWTVSGHGLASGTYNGTGSPWPGQSPNPGAMGCAACHDQTKAPHISHVLNDGDRLFVPGDSPALAYTDNVSRLCYNCHDPAQSSARSRGYLATSKATVHSTGVTGNYNALPATYRTYGDNTSFATYPGYQCSECHDAHGTTKIAMVLDNIVGKIGDSTPRPTPTPAFDYSGGSLAGGLDPSNVANNGVCDLCHGTGASNPHPDTIHPNNHNYGQNCASCHDHTKGFQASCSGCHGNQATSANWPDNTATGAAYPDRAGAHSKHVVAIYNANSGTLPGATVTEKENGTCTWCHPGNPPAGHSTDSVTGASQGEVTHMDTTGNGYVGPPTGGDYWSYAGGATATTGTAVYFKTMAGANDNPGFYRTPDHTCSTIACHGAGASTPQWYGDNVAPANVANLAADNTFSSVPGSIRLTWTAPGDDNNTGTAYAYDVRYSTADITDNVTFNTAAVVGGAPPPALAGIGQSMVAYGLMPGTRYYFALKTRDEVPNWSGLSNRPSAYARLDNVAPVFGGLVSATAADSSGTVNLAWAAASDDTPPIRYRVYWSTGAINYATPNDNTFGLDYQVTGLTDHVAYNFAVRAVDNVAPTPNVDNNTVVLSATPDAPAGPPGTEVTYYLFSTPTTGVTVFTGLVTDMTSACGTADTALFPTTPAPPSTTGFSDTVPIEQGLLKTNTSGTCASSNNNYAGNSTGWTGNTWRWGQAFYDNVAETFPSGSTFTGTTGTFMFRGASTTDNVDIYFAAVTSSSAYTLSANHVSQQTTAAYASYTVDLSTLSVTVPSGGKFAVLFAWNGGNTATAAQRVGYAGHATVLNPSFGVSKVGVNSPPNAVTVTAPTAGTYSGTVNVTWNAVTDPNGDAVHYDVYGSVNNGTSFPYIIATGITGTGTTWNTLADQVGLLAANTTVRIKVVAGDVYSAHNTGTQSVTFTVNNTQDTTAPGRVTDLLAVTLTQPGKVRLTWTAPGDDGYVGRANRYDIRYSAAAITDNATFGAATVYDNTMVPQLPGVQETLDVGGLTAGTTYHFALKTRDEVPNWSLVSNDCAAIAGANCGVCHASPPNTAATAGSHQKHGTTQAVCGNCHGTAAATYSSGHSDGKLQFGFKTAAPDCVALPVSLLRVTFTQGGFTIYQDNTGGGGVDTFTGSDNVDNGTCFSFNALNVTGCHGTGTPKWGDPASVVCGTCHGDASAARNTDAFGRPYEDPGLDVHGAPPVDLSGSSTDNQVGAHLKHLNVSYRLASDSCTVCHKNYLHANGTVNVLLDTAYAGAGATWTPGSGGAAGTCSGTTVTACHGTGTPLWSPTATVACNLCHGFGGVNPNHVSDNGAVRACSWCHPQGHPKGAVSGAVLTPNYLPVGINYGTGGIHLNTVINARAARDNEAQLCWDCHTLSNTPMISEWGSNPNANTGNMIYNYGSVCTAASGTCDNVTKTGWQPDWTQAYWRSAQFGATPNFSYKTARIQSTHSANTAGTAAVVWSATDNSYHETLDSVADIRCNYCHDVHDRNLAPGDSVTGVPYLRGKWRGNPYKEDGAPQSGQTYATTTGNLYGAVPRGGTWYTQMGGYFIGQNAGNADGAAGEGTQTPATFAGLCILCHGSGVDSLDYTTGENLWVGTNGHSATVIGGTGSAKHNIFDYTHGRPVPLFVTQRNYSNHVPSQGLKGASAGYSYRGSQGGSYWPVISGSPYAFRSYNWGATVDNATTDYPYHKFTCAKCHNPHASRLPKLLITNCLDIKHNTWQNGGTSQSKYIAATLTDKGKKAAYYDSAQNCHRFDDGQRSNNPGWNKVSPW